MRLKLSVQHLNAFNQGQTDGTAVIKYGCCQRHGLFKRILVSLLIFFSLLSLAISDAVRTSLGPRGMDKMVYISPSPFQKIIY